MALLARPRITGRRPLPPHIRLLIVARAVNQLGAFSLAFLTILLSHDLGASLAVAGSVSGLFGLATIPSRLLGGRLSDRWGRRRTILAGLLGCALAQLGIAAAPDLAVAAVCCVFLGLAFELYEPPSQAMIADGVAPDDRTAAYALLTTALAVGNMGAGLLADVFGRSSLRWLFVLDAASCLACALIVRVVLPADRPPRPGTAVGSASSTPAATPVATPVATVTSSDCECPSSPWRDGSLLAMTASGTVFALVYILMLTALPLSLDADGLDPASAGLIMTASTVASLLARPALRARRLAGLSPAAAFAAGYLLMAVGLAGFTVGHSLPALLAPTALYSVGILLLMGRAFALVSGLAPPGGAARYLAVYGLSWGFATVLASPLGAWLIEAYGPGALWTAMSATCLAMAVAQPRLLRRLAAVPTGSGC